MLSGLFGGSPPPYVGQGASQPTAGGGGVLGIFTGLFRSSPPVYHQVVATPSLETTGPASMSDASGEESPSPIAAESDDSAVPTIRIVIRFESNVEPMSE